MLHRCKKHGMTSHAVSVAGRPVCRRCRVEWVTEARRKRKAKLIELHGGKCRICGYSRCHAALHFHHLNPKLKKFALSHKNIKSFKRLIKEAKKCILVCANCHAEIEAGLIGPVAQR